MSRQTFQVLYAKYNSSRSPKYRVTTEICEDANGRFVLKRADGEAARAHLEDIRRNGESLKDYYRGIRVIDVEPIGDALRFPYVTGQTLADQIDALHMDRADFIALINEKLDMVLSVREDCRQPFEATPEFEAVFGKVDLGGVPALNPANIDSLFTNFIETGDGVCCIDCEWVFHFPVPTAFIRYRILLYLYVTQVHAQLKGVSLEEMLGWFGFDKASLETYWNMDDRFQQLAHGKNRKYIYTDRYRKRNVDVNAMQERFQREIRDKNTHIDNLEREIMSQKVHIRQLQENYDTISNSKFWRITKPARVTLDILKGARGVTPGTRGPLRNAASAVKRGVVRRLPQNDPMRLEPKERRRQEQAAFPRDIKFSVLVPLYNTPRGYLKAMIQSVQAQTYRNWELCLADGSDAEHPDVERICTEFARRDKRILYRKLPENLGISGNTNACIDMATGDYLALFDHDDLLHPSALYEDMVAICEKDADFIYTDENTFHNRPADAYNPHYKPDYAPDTLRANNYICHFTVFSRDLLEKAGGGFRSEYDGSQDFDMVLRLTEQAARIVHIPKVLYYWRAHKNSVAESVSAKPYVIEAAKRAINDHLKRVGLEGEALDSRVPSIYRLRYALQGRPLISILIPNMDHVEDLSRCVDSIRDKTTYPNWEIVIIENNSTSKETFAYYDALVKDKRIRVVRWEGKFNYSAINNFGFKAARGKHILLLNNDTEVISPDWLEEMLMYSQRSDVGAVGAKLYYPDHTIQHAGLGIGLLTLAGHYHRHFDGNHPGYMGRLSYAQDLSGVTAACMMMPRDVYAEMGGLDESFEVAFNDVDLCMRIRKAGYLIVWTPFAELYHYESKSRGSDEAPGKHERFLGEAIRFQERWRAELDAGDPYYNPNLSLDYEDFRAKQ